MSPRELPSNEGLVTTMLKSIDPDAAQLRRKIKKELYEVTLRKIEKCAEGGDIWGLLALIPYDDLLKRDEELQIDNRRLIIQTAEKRRDSFPPGSALRYDTFIHIVTHAENAEDFLRAVPNEWIGMIPQKDASPARPK